MVGSFLDGDKIAFKSSTVEFCAAGTSEHQDIAIRVTNMAMAICEPTAAAALPMHQHSPKGRGL